MTDKINAKIVSANQNLWEKVLKETSQLLEQSKQNMIVQEGMIEMAKKKIELEKSLNKS